ncbi:MAG: protein kinase [Caldilineaceae bacterium]
MTDFEQQIRPFRLYSEIGRTPTTTKYRATDSRTGQAVALYILKPEWAQQPAVVQQFLAVGRQAIRLRHPNLVTVLDTGETAEFAYIATSLIQGQTIGERLRRAGRAADVETALHLAKGAAAALDYAHSEGFIHGHLTLGQLYLTDDNTILVDGFAQSVYLNASPPATAEGRDNRETSYPPLLISPFLAPEQARTGKTVDARTDVYSLGAIVYTMLLGRPPFFAEESEELLTQITEKVPPPPETINPTLPAAVSYVLKSVLAKDPTIRYGSAGELANALQQSSQWKPISEEQALPVLYNSRSGPQDPPRRRRGVSMLALLLMTALFGIVVISSIGLGALGDRFAFVRQAEGENGVIDQVRTLWQPESTASVEPTDNPISLTPVVMITVTPPPIDGSTAVAQASGITSATTISDSTAGSAQTVIGSGVLTATDTPSRTPTTLQAVVVPTGTETLATIPTLAALPSDDNAVNADLAESALAIDPLGLLAGTVPAGDVIINGNGVPESQVQIQVNGQSHGRANVNATGSWTLIVPFPKPGSYAITAQALAADGAVLATVRRMLTVAGAAETATLTPTMSSTPSATITPSPQPTATATQRIVPTSTATSTVLPTAMVTATIQPTANPTQTPPPTATNTPVATVTHTPPPTATQTSTVRPTATRTFTPPSTATNTLAPTVTNTPPPTVTNTPAPTATSTPPPTATNTPAPTVTYTRPPTVTSTPSPTATNTLVPTATSTPIPTATDTLVPTATSTPIPTATDTLVPTATDTPIPTATNTRVPTATNTPAPTATPTAVVGTIDPVVPGEGESGSGQRIFEWTANFTLAEGNFFEIVFWKPGQDPMTQSIGLAAPTTNLNVTLDLERLDEQLGELLDTGEYQWGVLLVRTTPAYERVKYLGGGRHFTYYRDGGGSSNPGSGGPSSGE